MKRFLPMVALGCFAASGFAQEIARYMPKEPLGTTMESPKQKQERIAAAQAQAMAAIEALGLYAEMSKAVTSMIDGVPINLNMGNAFPFLGFDGGTARLKLGTKWMQVPKDSVKVVKLTEQPGLANNYQQALAAYQAALKKP